MLVTPDRFHMLQSLRIWWPECTASVPPYLSGAPVVMVMHCSAAVAEALRPYAFTLRRYHNVLVDLSQPDEELWRGIRPRTRRYIQRARRLGCRILVNEETEHARRIINGLIARKPFRRPLSTLDWRRLRVHGDVFVVTYDDQAVAAQVVLVDRPVRARGLFGGTIGPEDEGLRPVVGPLHRYLFWFLFRYYKAQGVQWYDFGGAERNGSSGWSSLAQFKLAFGGRPVEECTMHLAGHPVLRSILRAASGAPRRWMARAPRP